MIKFVVALVEDFERVGIDVTSERKSIDGLKALKHIENLSATELNEIRFKSVFEFIGGYDIYALMDTDEWKSSEIEE